MLAIQDSPLFNQFVTELTDISGSITSAKICIAYHADPDGVAAGALVATWLEHHTGLEATYVTLPIATHEFNFEKIVAPSIHFDCLITLDLNLYTTQGVVETLVQRRQLRVLIVDDHEIKQYSIPMRAGFTFLNPRLSGAEPIPTSVMAAILRLNERGTSYPSRIATVGKIGALGDASLARFEDLLKQADASFKEISSCVSLISSYYARLDYDADGDHIFHVLRRWLCEDSGGLLSDAMIDSIPSLPGTQQEVDQAVDDLAHKPAVEEVAQNSILLDYLHVTSPFRVVNLVASRRRRRAGRAVIAVTQQMNHSLTMAELRQTKSLSDVDLTLLLNRIAKRMNLISFGGHAPAAGCAFAPGDVNAFVNILTDEINQWHTRHT